MATPSPADRLYTLPLERIGIAVGKAVTIKMPGNKPWYGLVTSISAHGQVIAIRRVLARGPNRHAGLTVVPERYSVNFIFPIGHKF